MACDIKILSASGTNLPQQTKANTVTIGGTAQDCTQVNVTMSCGGDSASKVANVGFNGSWAVVFDTSALGCTCGQNFSVNAYCVGNPTCFTETTFDLACTGCPFVNDIAFIVHLEPPTPICVNGTTRALVSLTAAGSLGPGTYAWDFDDGSTATTTVQYVDHEFEFPDVSYNVKLAFKPADASCPQTNAVKTLTVPDCGDVIPPPPPPPKGETEQPPKGETEKPVVTPPKGIHTETDVTPKKKENGGGGGELSCDALLVAAIGLMLVGGLGIAIAVCAKILLAGIVAGAVAALGVALFGVWWAICGKITSCDVMRKMHWLLRMIVLLGVPIGVLAGGAQAGGGLNLDGWCWAALLGYYGSIAWLKDRLETIMEDAGCPPTAKF